MALADMLLITLKNKKENNEITKLVFILYCNGWLS